SMDSLAVDVPAITRTETHFTVSDNDLVLLFLFWETHWFYATSHRYLFGAVPLEVGFVGMTDFRPWASTVLVGLRMASAALIVPQLLVGLSRLRAGSLALQRRAVKSVAFKYLGLALLT